MAKKPKLDAYNAVRAMFKAWLLAENVRSGAAADEAGRELDSIRYRVIEERRRFNLSPGFDFDDCALDQETASLFKRYLALSIAYDEELHRHYVVSEALEKGEYNAAYLEFVKCYDNHHNCLHAAMVNEMFADSV